MTSEVKHYQDILETKKKHISLNMYKKHCIEISTKKAPPFIHLGRPFKAPAQEMLQNKIIVTS